MLKLAAKLPRAVPIHVLKLDAIRANGQLAKAKCVRVACRCMYSTTPSVPKNTMVPKFNESSFMEAWTHKDWEPQAHPAGFSEALRRGDKSVLHGGRLCSNCTKRWREARGRLDEVARQPRALVSALPYPGRTREIIAATGRIGGQKALENAGKATQSVDDSTQPSGHAHASSEESKVAKSWTDAEVALDCTRAFYFSNSPSGCQRNAYYPDDGPDQGHGA